MRQTESRAFSQGWLFHSGNTPWWQPTGEKCDAVLDRWHEVNLPHCFNAEDTFTPSRGFYRGVTWYRKTVCLTEADMGRKIFFDFGAAFSLADVWVNEKHAGQFMGGYTGFSIDATDLLRPGDNLLAVRVDNSHNPDILPGIDAQDMDYTLYGGLYREAAIIIKERLHIQRNGITVTTPSVSAANAIAHVAVAITNDNEASTEFACTVVLRAPSHDLAVQASVHASIAARSNTQLDLDIELPNPALWSVDDPNLYTLEVQLTQDSTVLDADRTTVGFRRFEFTPNQGFFLNGSHVKLRGLNRHQDYPGLGNALPPRLQARDAELLKEVGANFVRLSHYPQHPAFLDACDRLGILIYEEIASWQYIGGEMFTRNAEYMMREMIARDKNHPSVILWGLLNEGRSKSLFERLHNVARECDPTRPTVYADNHPTEGKEKGTVFVPEVLGINYELEHLDEIRAALPDLKFVSSETTNYEHRRRGDVAHDIAQVERYRDETDIVEQREYMAGMALWSMHDYGTDYELSWPVQHSGAFDCYRLPKGGYWYLRARWADTPLVRIIGHWNWSGGDIPVIVCTNGESVELFLNGKSLGKRPGRYLAKWQVPYVPGTLHAVAQCGGIAVEHVLATAGDPAALVVESSNDTLTADGADVAEITVTIVDKDGNPVLTEDGYATFRVEGPCVIRGVAGIPCTAVLGSTGRILIQATTIPGPITVRASYRGLPEATIVITTHLP